MSPIKPTFCEPRLLKREQALDESVTSVGYARPDSWTHWQQWLTERDAEWKAWQKASEQIRALAQQADRAKHALEAASVEAAKWSTRWADCEKDYAELETEAGVAAPADPDAAFLSAIERYETAADKTSLARRHRAHVDASVERRQGTRGENIGDMDRLH